ncbi:transcriptional regulator, partial [Rhizobium ruizarguesonis]
KQAARRVNQKIAGAVPAPLRQAMDNKALYAWGSIAQPAGFDLAIVRRAIRDERKLMLGYRDELGRASERTIRPFALIYYS